MKKYKNKIKKKMIKKMIIMNKKKKKNKNYGVNYLNISIIIYQ